MASWVRRLVGALALLLAVMLLNTLRLPGPREFVSAPVAALPVPVDAASERLAEAVRFRTVSEQLHEPDVEAAFGAFNAWLASAYPRVFATLESERVNGHSLLLRWPGERPGTAALLLAHTDVVPVEAGTAEQWTRPPFAGAIDGGHIWGRGTLDDKSGVLGWLEAAEALIAAGIRPERDIWFAFGHDEEIGGRQGAAAIAALLRERGVVADVAIDEGGAITRGVVPGVARPVASIMIGEKGYASFRLSAESPGGHSSSPPIPTAAGRIARAVARLEAEQMPRRMSAPLEAMFAHLAPELPTVARLALANRWALEGVLLGSLGRTRVGNAMTRTATAPTLFSPGTKDNVLQARAWAVVNFRILHGDSVDSVREHIRRVVDDPAVRVEVASEFVSEPSPVSDPFAPAFIDIAASVREVFPDAVITTGAVIGATDLRHYRGLYRQRYNFLPVLLDADDVARFHGRDERIAVGTWARLIEIKARLLQRLARRGAVAASG